MLTPETNQGGQGAVCYCGCKTPLFRMVLPPWSPNCPSTNKASWYGAFRCSTGYEFAGHGWLERRGTALDWTQTVGIDRNAWNEGCPPGSNKLPAAESILFTGRGKARSSVSPRGMRRGAPPFTPVLSGGSRWSLLQRAAQRIATEPILALDYKPPHTSSTGVPARETELPALPAHGRGRPCY